MTRHMIFGFFTGVVISSIATSPAAGIVSTILIITAHILAAEAKP